MAEGSIRIIPDSANQTGNGSGSTETEEFRIIPASEFDSSSDNGTPSESAKDRRRAKRAALRATDRSNENQEVAPEPEKKTRRSKVEVKHYLSDTQALTNAKFYLSALEMMATSISGPNGEMTEFERAMMTPSLKRVLGRIPIEALEKGNIVLDSVFLVGGMTMYMNHVTGGIRWTWPWKRDQKKGVQTDTQAPAAAPMEKVVQPKTGDLDGLAIPVPEVFTRYMNGNI